MIMKQLDKLYLRRLALCCAWALGVFFIVASGGGGSSTPDTSCRLEVSAIAPKPGASGEIWIGVYSDTARERFNSVARLDSSGAELDWIPVAEGPGNTINTIAVAEISNDIYVGGDFSGGIFRLDPDGTEDTGFFVGTGFNGPVTKITPLADGTGRIYVAGYFTGYNGTVVSGLVRLFVTGGLDNGFVATTQNVEDVVLAGGAFSAGYLYSGGFASIGDSSSWLVRWRDNGDKDDGSLPPSIAFTTNISKVLSVTPSLDVDDTVYAGGDFTNGIIRLTNSGLVDFNFAAGIGLDGEARKIVRADDGSGDIYAVGGFTDYDGNKAMGIVRLNNDGSPDAGFVTGEGFSIPGGPDPFEDIASIALALDASGDIYVGGDFSLYDGTARNGLARLNDDGSLDMGFAVEITSTDTDCNNETIPGLD